MNSSQCSDIIQHDGANNNNSNSNNYSLHSENSNYSLNTTPVQAVLVPSLEQGPAGAPLRLEVDLSGKLNAPSCVPLCAITNPRSSWNKANNLRTFLRQINPDVLILSEHWGRKRSFQKALAVEHYEVKESSQGVVGIPTRGKNGALTTSVTGGGVAIIYCKANFIVEDAEIDVPVGIEAAWIILTPRNKENRVSEKDSSRRNIYFSTLTKQTRNS